MFKQPEHAQTEAQLMAPCADIINPLFIPKIKELVKVDIKAGQKLWAYYIGLIT